MLKKIAMVISCLFIVACGSVEPNLSSSQSEIVAPSVKCQPKLIDLTGYQNAKMSEDGKSLTAQKVSTNGRGSVVIGTATITCDCSAGSGSCSMVKTKSSFYCSGTCSNGGTCGQVIEFEPIDITVP